MALGMTSLYLKESKGVRLKRAKGGGGRRRRECLRRGKEGKPLMEGMDGFCYKHCHVVSRVVREQGSSEVRRAQL